MGLMIAHISSYQLKWEYSNCCKHTFRSWGESNNGALCMPAIHAAYEKEGYHAVSPFSWMATGISK